MLTPRHVVVAGIVLIALAAALATGGHGFWLVFPLFWMFGGCGRARRWDRRGSQPQDDATAPDPTHDRHEAFPGSR